ncbi:hypothetical protein QYM36_009166, partial [Artemia franciscana]
MISVFDTILNAIDSKLKKIDTLERAVERLNGKIEDFESRHIDILDYLRTIDQRLLVREETQFGEPGAIELEPKIAAIDEKVSSINNRIHVLANHLDINDDFADNDTFRAFPSQDSFTVINHVGENTEKSTLHDVKTQITLMDKNIRYLTEFVADHMTKVLDLVVDVKGALMGEEVAVPTTTPMPANISAVPNG